MGARGVGGGGVDDVVANPVAATLVAGAVTVATNSNPAIAVRILHRDVRHVALGLEVST